MCQPLQDETNYFPFWNIFVLDYKIQCFQEFISQFSKPTCSEKCQLFPFLLFKDWIFSLVYFLISDIGIFYRNTKQVAAVIIPEFSHALMAGM